MAQSKREEFDQELVALAELGRALAHPARVAILRAIAHRNGCVCGEIVDLLPLARQMLGLVDNGKGVLVLTDIFGASPSNLALKLLEPGRIEGIAGVNLPMLLRALTYRERGMDVLLTRAIAGGRDGIINMQDH